MWLLLQADVDPNRLAETVLASEPVTLMIAGVLIVAVLMAAMVIVALVVAFKLTNKYFDGLDEKREDETRQRSRELQAQEDMAGALKSLTGQNDARYKLLQQQVDLMRENREVGVEARDEARKAREAVEDLKPSVESIEALVKALPADIQNQLSPVVEGVSGLSALIEETKAAQVAQIENLIQSNEHHNRTLQGSVDVIQRSFTTILATMVSQNGIQTSESIKEGAV